MAIAVSENVQSRRFTIGRRIARELIYDVQGTDDEEAVRAAIEPPSGAAPAVYLGLLYEEMDVEPVYADTVSEEGVWKVRVSYLRAEDDSAFTFDTTGGVEHITQSFGTAGSYARPGETAPNFEQAIGVTDDRVEGVDKTVPKLQFTETYQFAPEDVDIDYVLLLSSLTGTVNEVDWRGYASGSLKFDGAVGDKRADAYWVITFRFSHNPNRLTPYDVGEVTGVQNLGWEYVWTRYAEFVDTPAVALVKRPISVHVEIIYRTAPFADLGIGS